MHQSSIAQAMIMTVVLSGFVLETASAEILEVKGYTGVSQRGKQVYDQICSSCHSPDTSLVGPAHRGVFGRRAGRVQGYKYSDALKRSDVVWTADNLYAWLTNPDGFIPGSAMFVSLSDPQQRADVVAYLKTLK